MLPHYNDSFNEISSLITNYYILLYFSHKDDKDSSFRLDFKIYGNYSFNYSRCQELIIPLDISNNIQLMVYEINDLSVRDFINHCIDQHRGITIKN